MKQVTIQPVAGHVDKMTVTSDAAWAALKTATPAQIDAWLLANVNSLADARKVLRMLLLGMRYLINK